MLLLLQLHFLRILHIRIRSFVNVHISVEIKEYPFIPIFTCYLHFCVCCACRINIRLNQALGYVTENVIHSNLYVSFVNIHFYIVFLFTAVPRCLLFSRLLCMWNQYQVSLGQVRLDLFKLKYGVDYRYVSLSIFLKF